VFGWSLLRQGVRPFLERLFESPANHAPGEHRHGHDHGHGHDHTHDHDHGHDHGPSEREGSGDDRGGPGASCGGA
jgi:ABC-type nickel/cobalt efflux system permease component RcnA